jgi:cellobiose-specific phosphotransferase system component IIA
MPRTLTDQDLIAVLESIIRESGDARSKIAAIRQLREKDKDKPPAVTAMAELYELAPRRRVRSRS